MLGCLLGSFKKTPFTLDTFLVNSYNITGVGHSISLSKMRFEDLDLFYSEAGQLRREVGRSLV